MWFIGAIVGAVLGALVGQVSGFFFGGVLGGLAGWAMTAHNRRAQVGPQPVVARQGRNPRRVAPVPPRAALRWS
jgi:hypothetical protein